MEQASSNCAGVSAYLGISLKESLKAEVPILDFKPFQEPTCPDGQYGFRHLAQTARKQVKSTGARLEMAGIPILSYL
jgi:hypothetical protein